MGVLNVTPDSFSDGGHYTTMDAAVRQAESMLRDGARIIDIGGESTRPGAEVVSSEEELERVVPVVARLVEEFGCLVSLDTSCPEVMREGAKAGAGIINDVRSLTREGALEAAAASELAVCVMHMRGEPATMQQQVDYDAPIEEEVLRFLEDRIRVCQAAGISMDKMIVDPGFGFAKTIEHNLRLMNRLHSLQSLERPLLVGVSRKSMIGKALGREVEDRLPGGLALAALAVQQGAAILRTHDVGPTVDAVNMAWAVLKEGTN
ncbi:dihydropteroate synthase [Larsenimonas suaedae]|uniref:dihydropteroate synthase n=1 Tax=Larsenimonas suaedae TaxID=1851019 RepID=A0ABU1H0I4_9GAMM|nr:dihydropteroate synthase [Larsenimonas suaedae]MCM2973587.1 dihydropteroate synthase [Larsenimonas suaedae]MDR5897043.1 dihydropteroate synthase [Larsenimonas suaedae]